MECKSIPHTIVLFVLPELIDTLWNVNAFNLLKSSLDSSELIDTLWNVNMS